MNNQQTFLPFFLMFIFLKFTIGFDLVPWFEVDNIQSLVLCNRSLEDSDLEEVISVTKRNNIQITNSFCEKFDFTNSIILIDNHRWAQFLGWGGSKNLLAA